jgi:hypothetical protein
MLTVAFAAQRRQTIFILLFEPASDQSGRFGPPHELKAKDL